MTNTQIYYIMVSRNYKVAKYIGPFQLKTGSRCVGPGRRFRQIASLQSNILLHAIVILKHDIIKTLLLNASSCRPHPQRPPTHAAAHLEQLQAVLKGLDAQLGKQRCLGSTDLVARLDQVHIRHNLDGSLVNLGGDTQGLRGTVGGGGKYGAGEARGICSMTGGGREQVRPGGEKG